VRKNTPRKCGYNSEWICVTVDECKRFIEVDDTIATELYLKDTLDYQSINPHQLSAP
jgi:hypothetical protein